MPFNSQPGAVLTRPGNLEPGTFASAGTNANVTAPTTLLGTLQTDAAPILSAGGAIVTVSASLAVQAWQPQLSATVQVIESATSLGPLTAWLPVFTASALVLDPATWLIIAAASPTVGGVQTALRLHTVSDQAFAVHTVMDFVSS